MFDVGFTEILLLSLVGLLVLGPERLPRVARTLGGLARKARSSWLSLKRSIEEELRAEELKEPLKHFQNEIRSTVDDVKSGVDSIRDFDPTRPETAEKPGDPDTESTREADPAEPEPADSADTRGEPPR
jgi:sec-independent protein translocase protein TatB